MKTVVRRMWVLDGGTCTVEASSLVPGTRVGVAVRAPIQMFLVETSRGYVLVDTGMDPDVIHDPAGVWGPQLAAATSPRMGAHNHPYEQLRLLGLTAADIKLIVYTHLHHDHCGGARFFPDAIQIVQRAEYRWAFQPERSQRPNYVPTDYAHDHLKWQLADGDWSILPGVQLISTPGHTPGHQSVVLYDVPDCGTMIIAGDAVNHCDNIALDIPPGMVTDTIAAAASLHRLTSLADAFDASLLVSHDYEFYSRLPLAPEPLTRVEEQLRRFYDRGIRTVYGEAIDPHCVI